MIVWYCSISQAFILIHVPFKSNTHIVMALRDERIMLSVECSVPLPTPAYAWMIQK